MNVFVAIVQNAIAMIVCQRIASQTLIRKSVLRLTRKWLWKHIAKETQRIFNHMKIKVQIAIMSHLSDVQELIHLNMHGRCKRWNAREHINFVKQLILTYPDISVEVEEEELNEIWRKVNQ